jgi:hypothetical protein
VKIFEYFYVPCRGLEVGYKKVRDKEDKFIATFLLPHGSVQLNAEEGLHFCVKLCFLVLWNVVVLYLACNNKTEHLAASVFLCLNRNIKPTLQEFCKVSVRGHIERPEMEYSLFSFLF